VYGTLKRGFPLHALGLTGQHLVGMYRTVINYPMIVAGPWFTPIMLNEPGQGWRVYGELYEVENSRIASLDAIEHIGKPGNSRASIDVEPIEGGANYDANVYFKARASSPIRSTRRTWKDIRIAVLSPLVAVISPEEIAYTPLSIQPWQSLGSDDSRELPCQALLLALARLRGCHCRRKRRQHPVGCFLLIHRLLLASSIG